MTYINIYKLSTKTSITICIVIQHFPPSQQRV